MLKKGTEITIRMGAGINSVTIKEPSGTTVIDRNTLDKSQDAKLRRFMREAVTQ